MKVDTTCICSVDLGNGFEAQQHIDINTPEVQTITLPAGTQNVRFTIGQGNRILYIKSVKGCCKTNAGEDLWYDLAFDTTGYRLGHNLFLLEQPNTEVTGADFRFATEKVCLAVEVTVISPEETESLKKSTERLHRDRKEFFDKWTYQVEVYDKKVQEVEALEADKVELDHTIQELRNEVEFWRSHYRMMENSLSWRITTPIRSGSAAVKQWKAQFPLQKRKKAFAARVKEVGLEQAKAELFRSGIEGQLTFLETEHEKQEQSFSYALNENAETTFGMLLSLEEASPEEMEGAIKLILNQKYAHFKLYIWDTCGKNEKYTKKLLKWYEKIENNVDILPFQGSFDKDGRAEATEQQLFALWQNLPEQYSMWVKVSDVLSPYFLVEVATRLEMRECGVLYTDSDFYGNQLGDTKNPWYKPDFSPDYLRSMNYVGSSFVIKKTTLQRISYEEGILANHGYGLLLQLTELLQEQEIAHLPRKLFYEKYLPISGMAYEKDREQALHCLENHLKRQAESGKLPAGIAKYVDKAAGIFAVEYQVENPLISIMIPNKDHIYDLKRCVESLEKHSTYKNYEIIILENNSAKKETFDYYAELEQRENIRVLQWKEGFNYAAINNFGEAHCKGEYVLLLNNDIEILTPDWIEQMLMYASRQDVGAVGAKLLYMDDTVQHAGVIIGLGGVAAHSHKDYDKDAAGYMYRLKAVQNLSAVTAACLMMRREVYEEIQGMDEGYQVAFNDADFCMKVRKAGYKVVWTPYALHHHDESKSRGVEDTPEKAERFESEVQRFKKEWPEILQSGDPYYNPNLTTREENFAIKDEVK